MAHCFHFYPTHFISQHMNRKIEKNNVEIILPCNYKCTQLEIDNDNSTELYDLFISWMIMITSF